MIEFINELNESNSTNHKLDVLKKHKANKDLQRLLKMTYDKAAFTYGITLKHWHDTGFPESAVEYKSPDKMQVERVTLTEFLDHLETRYATNDVTRKITGNAAIEDMTRMFMALTDDDMEVAKRVIDRDLKINIGRSQINKIWKDLIIKPAYMRCGLFDQKTAGKIKFPAILQLKADGTYREALVEDGKVTIHSRQGETYEHKAIEEELSKLSDGYYFGELTVDGVSNRAEGNGLIKKDPNDPRIRMDVWDMVTIEEYRLAKSKSKTDKPTTTYEKRFEALCAEIAFMHGQMYGEENSRVRIIETHVVNNVREAMERVVEWMNEGLEGGVLKDRSGVFKDGTSAHQLKMKLDIDLEVRVTGFKEGKPGTKREKTFGAIYFATDDGLIQGACSGFNDAMLEAINADREAWMGRVVTVRCNDITKARDNDYHALSHPRFIEDRDDKDTTDTLESAMAAKESAMNFE